MSSEISPTRKFYEQTRDGTLSAVPAVLAIQPMIYFKNKAIEHVASGRSAQGQRFLFDKNIFSWYRGVSGFAGSFVPTIALQNLASGFFSNFMNSTYSAVAGGVFSAFAVCPSEAVMIQQQKTNKSFFETVKSMFSEKGFKSFYKGMSMTAGREGMFCLGYMEMAPHFKAKLKEKGASDWQAQVLGGAAAGLFPAVLSHPLDAYKTVMQQNFCSLREAFAKFPFPLMFTGVIWRMGMVGGATAVMSFVQDKLKEMK